MSRQNCNLHIGVFLPALSGGGAERVTLNLVRTISTMGHRVDLVLMSAKGPYLAHVPNSIRIVDLKLHSLRPTYKLFSIPALTKFLRKEHPQILLSALHSANVVALLARFLARSPTRIIIVEHATLSKELKNSPSKIRKWMRQLMITLMRLAYPKSEAVVAVSEGVANDLIYMIRLHPDNVHVIYNPVVDKSLLLKAQQYLEHPWFRAGGPSVVLSVGNLVRAKDHITLIRAFELVRREIPAHLLILGEGKERQRLEALTKELEIDNFVSIPGFEENPYKYMACASVFVLSSRWEALPTVLIEALACGVPIVSTNCCGGVREILQDGEYGILVPVGDIEQLAASIVRAIKYPGDSSRRIHRSEQFGAERITKQYLELFVDSIMKRGKSSLWVKIS